MNIATVSWYSNNNMTGGSESFWDQFPKYIPKYKWNTINYSKAANAIGRWMQPDRFGLFELEAGFWIDEYLIELNKVEKVDLLLRNSWTGGLVNVGIPQIVVYQDVHHTAVDKLYPKHYNPVEFHRIKHIFTIPQQVNGRSSVCNVAVSNFVKEKMKEMKIDCQKVIPHGIDMDLFKPTESNFFPNLRESKKVLYVGRFHPQKGWHILRELAIRNPNIQFIVMGMDKFNYIPTLENIHLLNPILREQIPELYSSVDAVVISSACESFGLVSLEAAACNTPIVTTKTGLWWDWQPKEVGEFAEWNAEDFDEKLKIILKAKYQPRECVKHLSIDAWKNEWKKLIDSKLSRI